jgi:hypothetical protein
VRGVPAAGMTYDLLQPAQKGQGSILMLTEGLRRAETRRRVIVDDRQAAEAVGVRGKGCCRGSPGFWSPRAGSASSWEAREMISTAGGTPAVKNCGGGPI